MIWAAVLGGAAIVAFAPGYICDAVLGRGHPLAETAHCFGISAFFSAVAGAILAVMIGGSEPYWPIFAICCVVPPLLVSGCTYRQLCPRRVASEPAMSVADVHGGNSGPAPVITPRA